MSLAHHGVLFLDEIAELRRPALEALRQPLEDGAVTVCRTRMTHSFPARPMLVAATNPCPCGSSGDGTRRCTCDRHKIMSYRQRLSGPLLDRLDFHVVLPRVNVLDLDAGVAGESSRVVRARVERARAIQLERWRKGEVSAITNAHLSQRDVLRVCALDLESRVVLKDSLERLGLSARAYGKVLRVARTLADMDGETAIRREHVGEAITGRVFDRDTASGHTPLTTDAA